MSQNKAHWRPAVCWGSKQFQPQPEKDGLGAGMVESGVCGNSCGTLGKGEAGGMLSEIIMCIDEPQQDQEQELVSSYHLYTQFYIANTIILE